MKINPNIRKWVLLSAIMAVAIFFRFYKLGSTPPGLYPDIAVNGMDAIHSIQNHHFNLFYLANNGREGLIMWLDALSMLIVGVKIIALKIPAAIIGVLTVLGVYLLSRKIFEKRSETIALFATFIIATSFWHTNFSRIGFRAIMVPFFILFSMYFLWKAFLEKRISMAIVSGLFFGLGFYTYISVRMAAPLYFCILAIWFLNLRNEKKKFVQICMASLISAFIVALPLIWYFITHPADFLGRAEQTSVLASSRPAEALLSSFISHLAMFNVYGDPNWRHNLPGQPELIWVVGVMFAFGVVIIVLNIIKSIKIREYSTELCSYSLLILWFIFLLLPGILSNEGIPHSLRTIGVIPPVMIIASVGGVSLYDWFKPQFNKYVLITTTILVLLLILVQNYVLYFIIWSNNSNVSSQYTKNFVDTGNLAASFDPQFYHRIIIVNANGVMEDNIPLPAQTAMFMIESWCSKNSRQRLPAIKDCAQPDYVMPKDISSIRNEKDTVIFLMNTNEDMFKTLSALFTNGIIATKNGAQYFEIP